MTTVQLERKLKALLPVWQRRLRLQDWAITLEVLRGHEIDGAYARTSSNNRAKQAIVSIALVDDLNPADVSARCGNGTDPEDSLVHELVHLHFSLIPKHRPDDPEDIYEEQAVWALAEALIAGYRGDE